MRHRIAALSGALTAVLLCHVAVCGAMYFSQPWPKWTHRWFCQQWLLGMGWIWNHVPWVTRWEENVDLFASIAAGLMPSVALLAGFGVYCAIRRRWRVRLLWKPAAVVLLCCWTHVDGIAGAPSRVVLREMGMDRAQPWWTMGTALTIYMLMLASVARVRWRWLWRITPHGAVTTGTVLRLEPAPSELTGYWLRGPSPDQPQSSACGDS